MTPVYLIYIVPEHSHRQTMALRSSYNGPPSEIERERGGREGGREGERER